MLVIVYVFWFIAMGLSASFAAFLHEVNEENSFMTFVELSEYDAWYVVVTWYFSILFFGWLALNLLRIFICASLAPGKARAIFTNDREDIKNGKKTPGDP